MLTTIFCLLLALPWMSLTGSWHQTFSPPEELLGVHIILKKAFRLAWWLGFPLLLACAGLPYLGGLVSPNRRVWFHLLSAVAGAVALFFTLAKFAFVEMMSSGLKHMSWFLGMSLLALLACEFMTRLILGIVDHRRRHFPEA